MHSSRLIAQRFVELAREQGETLTPMQLLKLVYIAHGWMLALHHRPLIRDEVQAWQYGPVIPTLYNVLRDYRGRAVDEVQNNGGEIEQDAQSIVDQVFGLYGHMSGPALSRITHAPGTPWDRTYVPGEFGIAIPDDLIEDHYAHLARARMD